MQSLRNVSRWSYVIVLGAVGLVVAVYWIFRHWERDEASRYAATAISLFVAIKTVYDVLDKENEKRKKADEGKESLELKVCTANAPMAGQLLALTAYNNGKTPVSIESVTLFVNSKQHIMQFVERIEREKSAVFGSVDQRIYATSIRLESKDSRVFVAHDAYGLHSIPPLADQLKIVVKCHSGMTIEVPGERILELVKALK